MAIERGHDLRYDNTACVLLSKKHQLIGKRSAANERDARIDHAREEIARLLDELRRGPIARHHDHGPDRNAALAQLIDGIVDVNGVALIVEAQNRILMSAESTYGFRHTAEAGITVGILLSKYGDLAWLQPFHLHQIVDCGCSFFRIAGTIVEHITVRRIAPQQSRAGK